MGSKWGKDYWIDFFERLGSTLGVVFVTFFAEGQTVNEVDWESKGWMLLTIGILTAVKLLMANLKDPASGGSLVDHPPGPEV